MPSIDSIRNTASAFRNAMHSMLDHSIGPAKIPPRRLAEELSCLDAVALAKVE